MIRLEVKIIANGQSKTLDDYLVPVGQGLIKVRQAAKVMGLMSQYERGRLCAEDFEGKRGELKLGVKKDRGYAPKNVITEYLS